MSYPVRASRRGRGAVPSGRVDSPPAGGWHPDIDVSPTDDGWLLVARLPGVAPDEVTVDIGDSDLAIHAAHSDRTPRGVDLDLSYRLALPAGVDPDAIDATMRDGILQVRMPRSATPAPVSVLVPDTVDDPVEKNAYVDDSVLGPSAESVVVGPDEGAWPAAAAPGTVYRSVVGDR
jgi:HSP20 family molecular chaperone IbpA